MGVLDDVFDKVASSTNRLLGRRPAVTPDALPFPGLTAKGVQGAANGAHVYVEAPPEFEASSLQVCGFWPFSVGRLRPWSDAVLGKHFYSGGPVLGDPMTAFKARLISAPSAFMLALSMVAVSRRSSRGCSWHLGWRRPPHDPGRSET